MTQIIVRNVIRVAPFLMAISLASAESIPTNAVPAVIVNTTNEPVAAGKFSPTWASLKQYQTPEWFRDAKFGVWACFGPQCQAEDGDWYRSEEHTSELQSLRHLVCRLLLEK